MSLIELWNETPAQLEQKQVQQLIAFAGEGKLRDSSLCSSEFRSFLAGVPSKHLTAYANQCLNSGFPDSGLALQDVINEVGVRLGAEVEAGRYRGVRGEIGFDGLWTFPNDHSVIVEVKTTDTYRIDLDVIAKYRDSLIEKNSCEEKDSSILLIVGRQDTGDLEAQIRGSRHAWDVRILSVEALVRLMLIKEELETPGIVRQIHEILIPREFTRLDEIANVLFSATEDIKEESVEPQESEDENDSSGETKATPVAFHDACISKIEKVLDKKLVKRTRAHYSTPDKNTVVNCSVSKEHEAGGHPSYWFAFHPHQREGLEQAANAYVAYGCGSSEHILLIPFKEFEPWLGGFWTTTKDDKIYWHVSVQRIGERFTFRRRKDSKNIDVTKYLVS